MTSKRLNASLLASALLAGLAAVPAVAQTRTPRVDQAQQAIDARIHQGMASGYITPSEAQFLLRRARAIEVREAQFKANGQASYQERQALRSELNDLSLEVDQLIANRDVVRPGYQLGQGGSYSHTSRMDQQAMQISARIQQGIRDGRIDRREERRLRQRELGYARQSAAFSSDGHVSGQERRQLRDELASLREDVERMIQSGPRYRG
jgi:hypothetical protein